MSANADGVTTPREGVLEQALLAVSAVVPACLAASHALVAGDGAHDEAVIRSLGLGWTGAFRALDAAWAGLFAWLPVGTRALRAALASAVACGIAGGVTFGAARGVLERTGGPRWTSAVVAAIAALAATLCPCWQIEASAPGGSTLGALLCLAPVALAAAEASRPERGVVVALLAGLAVSYEPLVGLAAGAGAGCCLALGSEDERRALAKRETARRAAGAFVLGLTPFGLAFARRGSLLALAVGPFAGAAGERAESPIGTPLGFVREEPGMLFAVLAVAGLVVGLRSERLRAPVAGFAAVAVLGLFATVAGAPAGPTRYGGPVLAAVAGGYVLAAVALERLVVAVAEAKIPFARASATMILVIEAAIPARTADDASLRMEERGKAEPASVAWGDAAWAPLPAGAALLLRDPAVHARLLASRATGELRADLALVPMFDLAGAGAMRELARDPKLAAIWRDAALLGVQEEWSLSSLAQERPLVAAFDPGWERALARHLVPVGLFARFEPEPRGGSDRRRAMEDFSPATPAPGGAAPCARDRLKVAIDGDLELVALTTRLLRARLIALAAASERDVVQHAMDDVRAFSPGDRVAVELQRRLAASKGPIDVKDLSE